MPYDRERNVSRTISKVFVRAIAFVVLGLAATACALAAGFPERRIEIVVPVTPGSATDILARMVAEKLSERISQPVVVSNKPGAASKIGAEYVKRSAPDGYTLLVIHSGIMANPYAYKTFDLDLRKDFTYVVPLTWTPWVVAVHSGLPVKTVADLIAYGKANPGKLNFGTTGGSSELDVRMLMQRAGIDGELLLYPGGTQVLAALASNEIQVALNAIRGVESLRGHGVAAIAVTSPRRFALAPEIPTVSESGVPGFQGASLWFGLLGPAGMPKDVVEKLNREVNGILAMPDVIKRVTGMAHEVIGGSSEDFRKFALEELNGYERTAREARLEPR